MKKVIYLFILLLVWMGCSEKSNNKSSLITIHFDTKEVTDNYDFSSIVDTSFSIIPLQTNKECLIAHIDKVEMHKDKILILDELANSVFIFKNDGTFLNKICKVGRGNGEYIGITDMTASDSTIVIIDRFSLKKLEYNYDAKLISENTILQKIWANSIFFQNGMLYYLNNWSDTKEGKYHLFSFKPNSEEITKLFPFDKEPLALGINSKQYSIYGNDATIIFSGCDTIYGLTNGKTYPKYFIDFGQNKVHYRSGKVEQVLNENSKDKIIGINSVNETNNYLFFNVSSVGDNYICIYDKRNQTKTICPGAVANHYFSGFGCNFQKTIDDKLIQTCNSHDLKFFYKTNYSKNKPGSLHFHNKLQHVMEKLNEQDNPVLFVFNLK